jgi:hypothetical protein
MTTTQSIERNDTVRVSGERGRWVVEDIYTPSAAAADIGRSPFVTVSYTRTVGRDTRTTVMDVHPDRLALVRKGNADDDFLEAWLGIPPCRF